MSSPLPATSTNGPTGATFTKQDLKDVMTAAMTNVSDAIKDGMTARSSESGRVKIEAKQCKEDSPQKILESCEHVINIARLNGWGDGFDSIVMEASLPSTYVDPATLDPSKPDELLIIRFQEMNTKCVALLLNVFTSAVHMNLIGKTQKNGYVGGIAHLAINELRKRALPEPEVAKQILNAEVQAIKVEEFVNPVVLEDRLDALAKRFRLSGLSCPEDLVQIKLEEGLNKTALYQKKTIHDARTAKVNEVMSKQLNALASGSASSAATPVTLATITLTNEEILKQMKIDYGRAHANNASKYPLKGDTKSSKSIDKKEVALSNTEGKHQVGYKCGKCGQKGHKQSECPNRSNGGGGRGSGGQNNNGSRSGGGGGGNRNGNDGGGGDRGPRITGNCN
jgi:uncharacterized membrane protein YgcG